MTADSLRFDRSVASEAATAQPVPDLHAIIRAALANHRLTHQHEEPDSGLLLVDALSCGEPTITKGKEELDLLADAIWFDVCAALTATLNAATPNCNCPGNDKLSKSLHAPNCPYRTAGVNPSRATQPRTEAFIAATEAAQARGRCVSGCAIHKDGGKLCDTECEREQQKGGA